MLNIKLIVIIFLTTFSISFGQTKKIAYCSNQGTSEFLQVFIMNEDGSDKKQLTDIEENCMKPKFSPDGKQITFYTDQGFVYLIRDVDNPNLDYTYLVWDGMYPSFMPNGSEIMFNSEYEDVLSVFVIDTAQYGAQPQLITDGSYSNMQVLSPDGNKLAFSTFLEGIKTIMIADLNNETNDYISKVSLNNDANLEPDFSPDGKQLVYASFDNNLSGTVRIFKDGVETPLTKGLSSSNVPRFSPDGKEIAFVVINNNNVDLYLMDTDGSNPRNLNISGGNVGTFQWMDNDRILYDAGTDSRLSVGIINVSTGSSEIIAEGGFNLHPSYIK
ncbi:MAG: PD40 domain-containing protein [Ignavibacteria bacterium]|nr:PD40 domain-containing protein [Ignavibacteria bacterium]